MRGERGAGSDGTATPIVRRILPLGSPRNLPIASIGQTLLRCCGQESFQYRSSRPRLRAARGGGAAGNLRSAGPDSDYGEPALSERRAIRAFTEALAALSLVPPAPAPTCEPDG